MEWTEMSIETLRRRLGGYLKHKRWYKTSSIDDDFYPFFAACWQHKELRMEILHRIDDWGPARYQTFVECIEAHLPKGEKPKYKLVPRDWMSVGPDGPLTKENTTWVAGPESSVYWDKVEIEDAHDEEVKYDCSLVDIQKFTERANERWRAHAASGGGEVPIENSSQSAVEMADDYNILTLDDETKKWWLTFHTHNPEFPGERITVTGDTETEARIAMERWRGANQARISGERLDPLSDMPYISANERLKLLQHRWIDKHGPSKGGVDKKYDFSLFVDPDTGEIDPEFLDDDARLKYQQCEWIEENGPVRDVGMIYRMERETIGALCENMEEQEEPQGKEYAARIEGDPVFTFLGLDHGAAKADEGDADNGITSVSDDFSGGCVSLPDEPVMGRRFESESGEFPSIYLDFINTYYVRDDAYRVTFASIWKRFGSCAKKHPSKKVMGQFLMSIGLERMHDTANMTIYQGIRPKSVKVQE
jgi:hypothetical protein